MTERRDGDWQREDRAVPCLRCGSYHDPRNLSDGRCAACYLAHRKAEAARDDQDDQIGVPECEHPECLLAQCILMEQLAETLRARTRRCERCGFQLLREEIELGFCADCRVG